MEMIFAKDRKEWLAWLKKNYKKVPEIYLVYYKTSTGKPSVSYEESVEEALRFGWIDGRRKSRDEETYTIRFIPRKPGSMWSVINCGRIEQLIKEDKMMPEGMAAVEEAKKNGQWDKAYQLKADHELPEDFAKALAANKKAQENFEKFSNTNKFSYIYQINALKNAEGRTARIKKVVELLEKNIKPYENGKRSLTIYKD